jgi:hypothetical protein
MVNQGDTEIHRLIFESLDISARQGFSKRNQSQRLSIFFRGPETLPKKLILDTAILSKRVHLVP